MRNNSITHIKNCIENTLCNKFDQNGIDKFTTFCLKESLHTTRPQNYSHFNVNLSDF